jgi:hypothetical protein
VSGKRPTLSASATGSVSPLITAHRGWASLSKPQLSTASGHKEMEEMEVWVRAKGATEAASRIVEALYGSDYPKKLFVAKMAH